MSTDGWTDADDGDHRRSHRMSDVSPGTLQMLLNMGERCSDHYSPKYMCPKVGVLNVQDSNHLGTQA